VPKKLQRASDGDQPRSPAAGWRREAHRSLGYARRLPEGALGERPQPTQGGITGCGFRKPPFLPAKAEKK
jgi:hypothetical protein